ncbi:FliH/SctL family protein [Sphingomonas sp. BK235]|uniref:FliH/SctL family protein n=1 Tax=Sphingomonas sp. BK235 TaxID=2512131 RepID=UPI0010DE69C8|nr:FliH/SctL family protein [Sphingomonas sp. BK235]TCP34363.1 flagellar biosynthesis/type III secretory pathway protein FliH [Sphingomonas sp. BK235]
MSFTLLHADRLTTLLAESPIVRAEAIAPLRDSLALLAATRALHDGQAATVADAADAARRAAHDIGYREGRAAGEASAAALLATLAARDRARAEARAHEIARLALEVVRRVADGLGPADLVAALAARAAEAVADPGDMVVRVAPIAVAATERRLADRAGLRVEADPALAPGDCEIETPLGRARAGLEVQLAQIARAWDVAEDDDGAR